MASRKDPALDPRSEVVPAIQTAFPQATPKAHAEAIAVLRKSNRANGGA